MNGFLHCALCFTKSNISQAYTYTHTHTHTHPRVLACSYTVVVYTLHTIYIYIWLGRVGTIHHLKRSKYTTVIRLEAAAAASRTPWPWAREHFGKFPLLTLSRWHTRPPTRPSRQTNDEHEVATACSSVAGVKSYYYCYIYICICYNNIIIVIISTSVFRGVIFMSVFLYAIEFYILYNNLYTIFSWRHEGRIKTNALVGKSEKYNCRRNQSS